MPSSTIVQTLWNYCNVMPAYGAPKPVAFKHLCSAQLTYLRVNQFS